jgi:proteasome activator subunit 4
MFQYILPLLPELLKAAELQDSNELAKRAQMLLVGMCGVTPPLHVVPKLLEAIFDTIQTSPSWRIRLNALPILQIFYFRQVPLIEEDMVVKIQDVRVP